MRGNQVIMLWRVSATGFGLEASTQLVTSAAWSKVATSEAFPAMRPRSFTNVVFGQSAAFSANLDFIGSAALNVVLPGCD